jgi:hypothetical protein
MSFLIWSKWRSWSRRLRLKRRLRRQGNGLEGEALLPVLLLLLLLLRLLGLMLVVVRLNHIYYCYIPHMLRHISVLPWADLPQSPGRICNGFKLASYSTTIKSIIPYNSKSATSQKTNLFSCRKSVSPVAAAPTTAPFVTASRKK